MGDQPRIAVVGSTMIDLVLYTARVSRAGETIQGHRDGFVISGVPLSAAMDRTWTPL